MADAVVQTAEFVEPGSAVEAILEVQQPDGLIPWFPGGHADPWNHVEAVMALAATGELAAAARGLEWLARRQRCRRELARRLRLRRRRQRGPCRHERRRLRRDRRPRVPVGGRGSRLRGEMFAVVDRALGFVVSLATPDGAIPWSVGPGGRLAAFSLLAASSSIYHSLGSGERLAATLGLERPAWAATAARVGRLVAERESFFADNAEFAMDWYYPALAGVLGLDAARARLRSRLGEFVVPEAGVLCRSDRRWVTTAETAECAIALARVGWADEAAALLATTDGLRCGDGSYLTGLVFPERSEFPPGERTSYSAAAVVLATDVLSGGVTAAVFDRLG